MTITHSLMYILRFSRDAILVMQEGTGHFYTAQSNLEGQARVRFQTKYTKVNESFLINPSDIM